MDWIDYRERLGIGFSDQDKASYFMVKIFNILDANSTILRTQIDENEYFEFCNMTGTPMKHGQLYGDGLELITNTLRRNSKTLTQFLAYYVAFINCQTDNNYKKLTRENYKNIVCNLLDESHIPFSIMEDKDGYFIFPKGAKELDDALISQPLEWLSQYPNARKTYIIALHQYADGIYIRDVADNLRKALETFLQEFLGNDKNLESNKNEICKYLGQQGVDAGISGLFLPLINSYKNVNDRIAKHNDRVDEKLLEFLLYQTGVLIRMVLSVKGMEAETNAD